MLRQPRTPHLSLRCVQSGGGGGGALQALPLLASDKVGDGVINFRSFFGGPSARIAHAFLWESRDPPSILGRGHVNTPQNHGPLPR